MFDPDAPDDAICSLALVQILARNINLPVIAAGGIMGLLGVVKKLYEAAADKELWRFSDTNPAHKDWVSVVAFVALGYSLYYFARKPLDGEAVLEEVEAAE